MISLLIYGLLTGAQIRPVNVRPNVLATNSAFGFAVDIDAEAFTDFLAYR